MHRQLVLIRHVHSPHPSGVSDFERPIDAKGRDQATLVVEHLLENDWLPETVITSAARRAEETWNAMVEASGRDPEAFEVESTKSLYGAEIDAIGETLWGLADDIDRVALVGHNPGFSDFATWLTGIRTRLPKGGVVVIEGAGDSWGEVIQRGGGELRTFVRPAELALKSGR